MMPPSHPIMSRRALLAHAAALSAASLGPRGAVAQVPGRILFGAAVQARHLIVDRGFREAIERNCDSVTPEVECKWDFVESERGRLNLRPADQVVEFAQRAGKRVHGHALLWHKSLPPWAVEHMLSEGDWSIIRNFFAIIITRYGTGIMSWDVLNEPIGPEGSSGDLRASPLMTAFGSDYLRRAFEDAREMAPWATLYLNEFGLVDGSMTAQSKRMATLRVLEGLKSRGVPVDGIGIQAHLGLPPAVSFDQETFARFLDEIDNLGLKIRISELDVLETDTSPSMETRDQRVADAVAALLDVATQSPALVSVTCWGLSDRYSWIPPESESAGLNRGLPFDSDLRAKPMYAAIRKAIH